jgi:hypothetical protein
MKIPTFSLALFSSVFLLLPTLFTERSIAVDDAPPAKDTKVEDIPKQLPSAISISVIDGVIKYINNERRAKFKLQWIPLGASASLREQAASQDFTVMKLRINNRDLENGNWIKNLNAQERIEVMKSLNVSNLSTLLVDHQRNIDDLSKLSTDTISVSEYMYMYRERNILKSLINSKGVMYSFGLKSQAEEILAPDYSDKNIVWYIDVYKFKSNSKGEFYRFTAKAIVESLEVRIPDDVISVDASKNKKTFYDVRFKLKNNLAGLPSAIFSLPSTVIDVPDPNSAFKNTQDTLNADLQRSLLPLSGFLSIFGGADKLGEAALGLLSGTDNTSIVGGGLVNFKEGGVSPFIGVNQEIGKIGDDVTSGILFGVGTGDKTSLYVGPSVQYSVFTISAGARLGTQVNSDVSFAGMVAVDLSRLTNSKRDPAPIPITVSNTGGGFGTVPDEIITKYTWLNYTAGENILLTRVCDVSKKTIPEANRKIRITLKESKQGARAYIPKGVYEYGNNSIRIAVLEDKLFDAGTLTNSEPQKPTGEPIKCY